MRVFVNCAPADRALAEQVSHHLAGAGLDVWFDGDVSGAVAWWQRCVEAVPTADVFVTLWTANLATARAATALLDYAAALGTPVLAVRSGPVDRPPFGPSVRVVEFGDPTLASTLQVVAQQTGPWPGTPSAPPWPFGYLTALHERVAAPALPPAEQHQVLAGLQNASAADGQYPAVRTEVATIAARLRARFDLDPGLRPSLDALAPPAWQPEPVAPQQHQWSPAGFPGYPGYPPPPQPSSPSATGRTIAIVSAVAVVAVIAVVVGAVLLFRGGGDSRPADASGSGSDTDEAVVQLVDDGIMVGSRAAPVTIDVFNDAMCPACANFITTYGRDIQDAVLAKDIRVHYHLIDMLDGYSASGDYSSRAAAAVYCLAADTDVATFDDFYAELFDPSFQPEEGGRRDHTNADLADLAVEVGASGAVADCISGAENEVEAGRRTAAAAQTMDDLGVVSVPAVYDGRREVDLAPGWVDALIR